MAQFQYVSVNKSWPEGTNEGRDLKPTPQEAITAAKRLYRFAFKKPFKGKIMLTSGNRYTYIRNNVLHVNPDSHGDGWHELVHSMSHYASARLYPNAAGHGTQHAFLEKEMINLVVSSGWLDGKLRRARKPKPAKADSIHNQILLSLKKWRSKAKRAETAIKKLERRRKYYEKQIKAVINLTTASGAADDNATQPAIPKSPCRPQT